MKQIPYLVFLFLASFFTAQAQSPLTEAEDFMVKDIHGNSYSLFSILDEGKIVVLPFFTTTCGSCNIYTPEIVLSHRDFGCNEGNVFYLGINWGADNTGVADFIEVHNVGYPCASGIEGLGNEVNLQYEIVAHITALVITPDRQIVGQFYGPDFYPERDTLNNLLLSLGAQMQDCSVGLTELESDDQVLLSVPNPFRTFVNLNFTIRAEAAYYIQVFNNKGQEVWTDVQYLQEGIQNIEINLETEPQGLYLVHITNKDGFQLKTTILKQQQK